MCQYLNEKVLFHMGWDTVQHSSGRTGFLKPPAKDLHPSLEEQRLLRCSKWTQIPLESTQPMELLGDWFTLGKSKDQHGHTKGKQCPVFSPILIRSSSLQRWHGKWGNFGLRISKLGQNVKENLNPEALRLKGWNWSWIFRRGEEPVKLFEGLEKSPYSWTLQSV